jgi:hypothetical protein
VSALITRPGDARVFTFVPRPGAPASVRHNGEWAVTRYDEAAPGPAIVQESTLSIDMCLAGGYYEGLLEQVRRMVLD